MSVLHHEAIEAALAAGDIAVLPLDKEAIQPASIDLRLGDEFLIPAPHSEGARIAHYGDTGNISTLYRYGVLTLEPGDFALGETLERVKLGPGYVGEVMGKSSIARRGLFVHVTGGYIDPGYEGRLTLELFNASPWRIEMIPGRYVCQVRFHALPGPTAHPYRSRYQNAAGVEGPKA